jgi:LysR family hydrogen peroxide-inducible transcriptional activator
MTIDAPAMVSEPPTLRQLTYLTSVAEAGSFRGAAEACHVSQPALSAQIKELERRLGVVLIERTTRRSGLTAIGRLVADRAVDVLRRVDELSALARAGSGRLVGSVQLGVIPTAAPYLLPQALQLMADDHPEADLTIHELRTDALLSELRAGRLDLALLALPIDHADVEHAVVLEDPLVLAVRSGQQLPGRGRVPVDVLADLPVLLLEDGHCLREQAAEVCAAAGSPPPSEVRGASLSTLCRLVASGAGATLLPLSATAIEAGPETGLVTRRFRDPEPHRTLVLAWRRSSPAAPEYLALAGELRQRCA